MEKITAEILIITGSIVLQQGLSALLESLPEITTIDSVKDLTLAYPWIESRQPRIVLLDAALAGRDSRLGLEKIQTLSGETQRILLVDDVQDMNLLPQYAEAILIKGAAPSAITTIVTNLLFAKGAEHVHNHSD